MGDKRVKKVLFIVVVCIRNFQDSCTALPEGLCGAANLWNEKDPTRERERERQACFYENEALLKRLPQHTNLSPFTYWESQRHIFF